MFELDVTALLSDFPPAVGFENANKRTAIHEYKYTRWRVPVNETPRGPVRLVADAL
jgi:hypothetical protein